MADTDLNLTAVFKTKSQYVLPPKKFMIPSSWARYHLSQLINKVLELSTPVPFDFLINGQVLRGSLAQWCTEKGVTAEESLEIEYVESMLPPQHVSSIEQDDWVSSVSCRIPSRLITASYDGTLKVHSTSKTLLRSVAVHAAPITSACIVGSASASTSNAESCLIATASHDMTAALTQLSLEEGSGKESRTVATLHLHTAPVSSIASDPSGSTVITASWDHLLGIWNTTIPEVDDAGLEDLTPVGGKRDRKRRKIEHNNDVRRKAPLEVLRSHTHRVSQVAFRNGQSAVSCGFDSTIRTWDINSAVCDGTLSAAEKPFTSLAVFAENQVFAASTDRTLSLYDVSQRTNSSAPQVTFMHPALPSCVCKSPSDSWRVLTGAYDGNVRVWDIRTAKAAVMTFRMNQPGKVLSADWTRGMVVLGGEKGVDVWKMSEDGTAIQTQ